MTTNDWLTFISSIPEDSRYELEERAAIHQFDGGMTKEAAERRTIEDYKNVSVEKP
jgi:hypothetical protein